MSESNAERIIQEVSTLKSEAASFHGLWLDCAKHCLPMQRPLNSSPAVYTPDPLIVSDLAADALNTLASGMLGWTTPTEAPWFKWEPHEGMDSEPVKDWLADCTRIAHRALANSNFYSASHLSLLSLGCYGTAALFLESLPGKPLHFREWPIGSFVCAESHDGTVDRVYRSFTLTARQAVDKWADKAPAKCHEDVKMNRAQNRHSFIHAIYPRTDSERQKGANAQEAMPFASCVIYEADKTIVEEGGFDSLPVFVSRWQRWSDESPWGVSPAMWSIAGIRGVNVMEYILTGIAKVTLQPRVITKTGATAHIDMTAGGVTQVRDMADKPETWGEPDAKYNTGFQLLERQEERVRRAFHTRLFESISGIDREMTATEILARQREQVGRVAPAFSLYSSERLNPVLERVFMLLFQAGRFPEPPQEAFVSLPDGRARLIFPRTVQTSRLSMAIDSMAQDAISSTLATFGDLLQLRPDLLDNVELDQAFRGVARAKGLEYLRSESDRDKLREQRAQEAQAAQLAEFAAKQPDLAVAAATAATAPQ